MDYDFPMKWFVLYINDLFVKYTMKVKYINRIHMIAM